MGIIIDITGKQFGKWTVLDQKPIPTKKGYYWNCKCECGTTKSINSYDLRTKQSTSCGCSLKLAEGESAFNWLYNHYKKQAKIRTNSVPFELTRDETKKLMLQDCYYCRTKPKNVIDRSSSNSNGVFVYNGIDRVDNSKGYTVKNCVPCCKICNSMKGNRSKKEFLQQVRLITAFNI